MITADSIRKIDIARVRLSECGTAEEVDKIFLELEITDYPSKNALLRRCMGIEKNPDNTANDETAYSGYLTILLTGKWRDTSLMKESAIPGSNSLDKTDKKQTKKTEIFKNEDVCQKLFVTQKEYNHFNKFYEENILPRMKKKYLSQLISVVEDMINEKLRQKATTPDEVSEARKTDNYRIMLNELKTDWGLKNQKLRSIFFLNKAVIFYDPAIDKKTIYISIAHELGHLLFAHGIIPYENREKYAKCFKCRSRKCSMATSQIAVESP